MAVAVQGAGPIKNLWLAKPTLNENYLRRTSSQMAVFLPVANHVSRHSIRLPGIILSRNLSHPPRRLPEKGCQPGRFFNYVWANSRNYAPVTVIAMLHDNLKRLMK